MARASAPPWDPTPNCRIDVVRAAIPPSLSAKSRRETYFRKELLHLNGPNFLGVDLLLITHDAVFWDVGAVISCASVNDRIHSSSSNCFEDWVVLLLQEDELRIEEESALFRQISCRPLDVENVELPKQSASSGRLLRRRRDGVQRFLPFT